MSSHRPVALVTGVSRRIGIGWAITQRLAADGVDVLATGWTPHDAEQPWGADPIDTARAAGESLDFIEADLADPDAPDRLALAATERFGRLDIVVAAHARSSADDLFEVDAAELDACWQVNTRASLLLVRALATHRPPGPGGRAVLFTSGQHLGPMDGEIAYAVSKGAINEMTWSLSNAVADRGITVNCINPGPVDTGYLTGDAHASVADLFPAKRWGQPSDTANLVSWLVSDDAGWITGQTINSEGGLRRFGGS